MAFAIIAAGGRGIRLGSPTPKFELQLHGKPLLMYSLDTFQATTGIESIILVIPEDRLGAWTVDGLKARGISKVLATVAGGETRQDSVRLGLERIGHEAGVVVVHDAARPLVTADIIERTCEIPTGADGVIPVVGVTDTVKEIDGAVVTGTLERSRLVAAQTPQAFRLEVLRKAHLAAMGRQFHGTDDASLVERIGGRVVVIDGSRDNIKLTFPEDLARAEAIILGRSER